MAKVSLDETQLERPYTFFLFKSIAGIHESWINGDVMYALSQACKLVSFLPTDIKNALWEDKQKIQKDMNKASRQQGTNYFTSQVISSRELKRVAHHHIEPFVDKMVRLLDEKGWLERGAMMPRYPTTKKLSVQSIET